MQILCLGDSITDCGRLWDAPPLGNGYVKIMTELSAKSDIKAEFYNRWIDGITLGHLLENVSGHRLLLPSGKPVDLITVLIGINDIGLMLQTDRTEKQQQDMLQTFFENYETLLNVLFTYWDHTSEASPTDSDHTPKAFPTGFRKTIHMHTQEKRVPQILLMEPFIFPYPDKYRLWIPLTQIMSQGIQKLAKNYHLPYLLLQDDFTAAGERNGWDFITTDGIHLTARGHQMLAEKLWQTIIPVLPVDSH